jgi:Tol biopolymer transport system component
VLGRLVTAGLVAAITAAGCGDDEQGRRVQSEPAPPVTAPSQQAPRIASVRLQPGNPPRFALVTTADDGSELRILARAPAGEIQRIESPAWSPDASRLYFVGALAEREGDRFLYFESDVFAVDAGGSAPRRVTDSRDVNAAVPSPDGKALVVARDEHPGERPFTWGLWLVDAETGDERRLLEPDEGNLDIPGSWSPDGRTILFTRCAVPEQLTLASTCAVHRVSRDGSGFRKLTDRSQQPAFSPDGDSIAFVTDRDEHGIYATGSDEDAYAHELYVMDADGKDERRLTNTRSLAEASPAWSPDGSRIAYEREGPARFSTQLMIVDADGDCPTRLIGDASDLNADPPSFESPAWRPGRLSREGASVECEPGG